MLVNQLPNLNCGPLKGNNRELNFNGTHSIQDLQDLRRYINEDGTVKNEEFLDHLKTKLDDEAQDKKGKGDLSTYGKNPLAIMVTFMAASLFMRGSFWADKVLIKAIAKKVMTETPESVKGLSGKIAKKLAPASDKANGIRGKISSFCKSVSEDMDNFFDKKSDEIMKDIKEVTKVKKKELNKVSLTDAVELKKKINKMFNEYFPDLEYKTSEDSYILDEAFGTWIDRTVKNKAIVNRLDDKQQKKLEDEITEEALNEIKEIIQKLKEVDSKIVTEGNEGVFPYNQTGKYPSINVKRLDEFRKSLDTYLDKVKVLKTRFDNPEMSDEVLNNKIESWNSTMKLGNTINKYTGRLFDALSVITGLYAVRIYQKTDSIRDAVEFKPPTDDNKLIEEYKLEEIEAQIKKTELDMDRIKNRKELNSKIAEKAQQLEELKAEKAKLVKA